MNTILKSFGLTRLGEMNPRSTDFEADALTTTPSCVTQLNAPQLCKETTASNENYVELNVILRQKSKFLNTIVCCLVVTRYSKQNKEFKVTQNREA